MLESGATTVWESFPADNGAWRFPTRSHCHGWSAAPSYFSTDRAGDQGPSEPRPAGQDRPRLADLTWAHGTVATVRGPIHVAWRLQGDALSVTCTAPKDVQVEFVKNSSHQGKRVTFNGNTSN